MACTWSLPFLNSSFDRFYIKERFLVIDSKQSGTLFCAVCPV
ncbi:hypothetical protein CLOHYLEM_04486 [[Clostridium] hylemonae DSM 15053]|uniref:Uncharacterized protein n=1 Tax=[Clostridium] hylemonae DSM 15053 TaxID=553973 RepID=C0BXE9_9FIRM|nr:hypothetical protein CLOHYLEM_04486 [[Clostridium] hylemonae DSM 15053]